MKSAIDTLSEVSVWPNGNKAVSAFPTCIVVFAFFALYPGTPPYAYLLILALVIWETYFGKWSRIREQQAQAKHLTSKCDMFTKIKRIW